MATSPVTSSSQGIFFNSSPVSQTGSYEDGYREFTRRLPSDELLAVEQELAKVTDEQVDRLIGAMNELKWDAPVFHEEKFPFYALAAFRKGKITDRQLTTVLFYWVEFSKEGIEARGETRVVPLFVDGAINSKAWDLIRQTMIFRQPEISIPGIQCSLPEIDPHTTFMTDEELHEFFRRAREELRPSERCFFIKQEKETPEIVQVIHKVGINIFYQTDEGAMRPSLGMMDLFLKVKYGPNAVLPHPCAGYSSVKDIHEGIQKFRRRDMAVHFPLTTLPSEADQAGATGFAISFHDFYHLLLVSGLSEEFRALWFKIADFAEDYSKKNNLSFAKTFYEAIIDMETPLSQEAFFNAFYKDADPAKRVNDLFWLALAGFFIKTKTIATKPIDRYFKPHIVLLTSLEERNFLESLLSFIPINEKYKQGRTQEDDAFMKHLDEAHREADRQVAAYPPYTIILNDPRPEIRDLRDNNIYRVLSEAWKKRLSSSKDRA